jgi:ROS/MUCR transcriptional regulator protein
MSTASPIRLATEMVAAFVSNNPLPRSEIPGLIHAVHVTLAKLRSRTGKCEASTRGCSAGSPGSQIDHPRLPDLSGRRQTIQVITTSPGRTRPDAGAVSREMEPAVRLSNGCTQLRRAAVRISEADRTWPDSAQSRRSQERRPVDGGQDLIALP